jgi:hypothetical protein
VGGSGRLEEKMKKIALGCALTLIIVLMGKAALCAEMRGVSRVYNEPANVMQDCVSLAFMTFQWKPVKPAEKMVVRYKRGGKSYSYLAEITPISENKTKVEMFATIGYLTGEYEGVILEFDERHPEFFEGLFGILEKFIKLRNDASKE